MTGLDDKLLLMDFNRKVANLPCRMLVILRDSRRGAHLRWVMWQRNMVWLNHQSPAGVGFKLVWAECTGTGWEGKGGKGRWVDATPWVIAILRPLSDLVVIGC